jgi:hypothetical protein
MAVPIDQDLADSINEITPPGTKPDTSRLQSSIPLGAALAQDSYGYTFNDTLSPAWMDLTSNGVEVDFPSPDEDWFGPISFGFSFPFYENTYTEFYVRPMG